MSSYLCLSVRFLQPAFHGRDDRGEPEWPPSPLRVFQALVAASAARGDGRGLDDPTAAALRWLERRPAPSIVAAPGVPSRAKYRLYVPDNVGDKVAGSWSRGGDRGIADFRTEKDVRPTRLPGRDDAVHYLWPASGPELEGIRVALVAVARGVTHVGWGVDMVAADASVITEVEAQALDGERWHPGDEPADRGLRVPTGGTLDALIRRHRAFLDRVGPGERFQPVSPLAAFGVASYRRPGEVIARPFAAFDLLRTDAKGFAWFDPTRRVAAVAGMIRHAAGSAGVAAGLGWPPEKVAGFLLGHGEAIGQRHAPVAGPRLSYLPLPSIESRRGRSEVVGGIRRALIAVPDGRSGDDLRLVARLLSGSVLVDEAAGREVATLSRVPDSDPMVRRYTAPSATWATVTPVILPGFDDPRGIRRRLQARPDEPAVTANPAERGRLLNKIDGRIDQLLRKSIRQAGYPDDLARDARIEWRGSGFWRGGAPATEFAIPEKLVGFRRLHVRLTWTGRDGRPIHVPGPICLGGGRFRGLGLLARLERRE